MVPTTRLVVGVPAATSQLWLLGTSCKLQYAWAVPHRKRGRGGDDHLLRLWQQPMPLPTDGRGRAVFRISAVAAAVRADLRQCLLHSAKWAMSRLLDC